MRNLERSVRQAPPSEDQGASSPILSFQVEAWGEINQMLICPIIYVIFNFERMLSFDHLESIQQRCQTFRKQRIWLLFFQKFLLMFQTANYPKLRLIFNMCFWRLSTWLQKNKQGSTNKTRFFCKISFQSIRFFRETNSLFSSTFPYQLLMSLLRLLQASDSDVRLLVLNTFQILVYNTP